MVALRHAALSGRQGERQLAPQRPRGEARLVVDAFWFHNRHGLGHFRHVVVVFADAGRDTHVLGHHAAVIATSRRLLRGALPNESALHTISTNAGAT